MLFERAKLAGMCIDRRPREIQVPCKSRVYVHWNRFASASVGFPVVGTGQKKAL